MSEHNKAVMAIVRDYENYLEFISEWQGYSLEQLSYSRWAIDEILRRLEELNSEPPLLVIEGFIEKVNEYSQLNNNSSFMFSVASNTAENIVDIILS